VSGALVCERVRVCADVVMMQCASV